MILSGEEARQFVRNNPGGYKILSGAPPEDMAMQQGPLQPQNRGFLGNLLHGVTKGPRMGMQALGALGRFAGDKNLTDRELFAPVPFGLDPYEAEQYINEDTRYEQGLKDLVGLGAYAVPGSIGAKSIGGMIKGGALGGAMGGYGISEKGKGLEGVLMGGLTGGAIGGLLGKFTGAGSKALSTTDDAARLAGVADEPMSWFDKKGRGLRAGVIDIDPMKLPPGTAAGKYKEIPKRVIGYLDELGAKTGVNYTKTRGQIGIGVEEAIRETGEQLDNVLAPFGIVDEGSKAKAFSKAFGKQPGRFKKIVEQLKKGMTEAGELMPETDVQEFIVGMQNEGATYSEFAKIKSEINGVLGKFYETGGDATLTNAKQNLLKISNAIDEVFKGKQFDPMRGLLAKQSDLLNTRTNIIKALSKKTGESISAPLAFGGIKAPTLGIGSKMRDVVGKGLEGLGRGTQGLGGKVSSLASGLGGMIPEGVGLRTSMLPAVGGMAAGQPRAPEQEPLGLPGLGAQESTGLPSQQGTGEREMMALQFLQADYKPGDVKTILDLLGYHSLAKVPGSVQRDLGNANSAIEIMDKLEQEIQQGGFGLSGALAQVSPWASRTAGLKSEISLLAQFIAKTYEGGKVSDPDIKRYQAMLPKITDPPQKALQKLRVVRQAMEGQLRNLKQQYETGGYDPYAGEYEYNPYE